MVDPRLRTALLDLAHTLIFEIFLFVPLPESEWTVQSFTDDPVATRVTESSCITSPGQLDGRCLLAHTRFRARYWAPEERSQDAEVERAGQEGHEPHNREDGSYRDAPCCEQVDTGPADSQARHDTKNATRTARHKSNKCHWFLLLPLQAAMLIAEIDTY